MGWTSKPVGLSQLWDRFYFQQMFAQNLLGTLDFPKSIDGFPLNILQFLRNLLALKTSWDPLKANSFVGGKETTKIVDPDGGRDLEMPANENAKEEEVSASKSGSVEDIERKIAALVMQKVLTAFLDCQQKVQNTSQETFSLLARKLMKLWGE